MAEMWQPNCDRPLRCAGVISRPRMAPDPDLAVAAGGKRGEAEGGFEAHKGKQRTYRPSFFRSRALRMSCASTCAAHVMSESHGPVEATFWRSFPDAPPDRDVTFSCNAEMSFDASPALTSERKSDNSTATLLIVPPNKISVIFH